MEVEYYFNGVLESMFTRIVNGVYKYEDLQIDEFSMGKGYVFIWCFIGGNVQVRCFFFIGRDLGWVGFGSLRSFGQSWFIVFLVSYEWVFEVGRFWFVVNIRVFVFEVRGIQSGYFYECLCICIGWEEGKFLIFI